jgi:hypothetical protein
MKSSFLLPHNFKKIGWALFLPGMILGIVYSFNELSFLPPLEMKVFSFFNGPFIGAGEIRNFSFIHVNVYPTLVAILFLSGALLVGFSKEKHEDEFIARLRLSSLLWAVLINYSLLLLTFLFVYGIDFLLVMLYNMFTTLLLFIGKFQYLLYKSSKIPDEK